MTKTTRSPLHPETRRSTSARREVRLLGLGLAALVAATGCPDNNPASDARGNYELAYDNQLTVRLKIGGVVREAEANEDDTVTFETDSGPVTIDLNEFCGRDDVQCPSEALWTDVSVDQPNIETDNPNTHVINFIDNTNRDLPAGERAPVISGLVDERDRFGLLIDARNNANGDCGLLAISTAGGRFSHEGERLEEVPQDPVDAGPDGGPVIEGAPRTRLVWDEGAPVVGIEDGKVKLGFLGACAFGPALVAATFEIETGFVGTRMGPLDPPPFTPLDPATLDGGLPDPTVDGGDGPDPVDAGDPIDGGAPPDAGDAPDAGDGGDIPDGGPPPSDAG